MASCARPASSSTCPATTTATSSLCRTPRPSPTGPPSCRPTSRPGCRPSNSGGHEADDAGGLVDELHDLAALEVLGDVGDREGGRARDVLGRVARELDGAAYLAVDLNAQRDGRVDRERLVPGGPARREQEALAAQAFPGLVPRCGAYGPTSLTSVSTSARVADDTPPSVSALTYSIMAATPVLNCMRSRSAVTRLMVLWRTISCGSFVGALAASHSSINRHTRLTKRLSPSMARGSHGLGSSNSPMNIS